MKWNIKIRSFTQFVNKEDMYYVLTDGEVRCGSKVLYSFLFLNKNSSRKITLESMLKLLSISDVSLYRYIYELISLDLLAYDENDVYMTFYLGSYNEPASEIKQLFKIMKEKK